MKHVFHLLCTGFTYFVLALRANSLGKFGWTVAQTAIYMWLNQTVATHLLVPIDRVLITKWNLIWFPMFMSPRFNSTIVLWFPSRLVLRILFLGNTICKITPANISMDLRSCNRLALVIEWMHRHFWATVSPLGLLRPPAHKTSEQLRTKHPPPRLGSQRGGPFSASINPDSLTVSYSAHDFSHFLGTTPIIGHWFASKEKCPLYGTSAILTFSTPNCRI